MTVSVYSEIVYPTHVRRRYLVTLTDNLGTEHEYIMGMFNHQPSNNGSEVEAQKLASVKQQEIQQWISQMESGEDPWHTAPFINSIPLWNTWETASIESLKHYLLSEDRQELLNVEAGAGSTSNVCRTKSSR